ncbi:hypothetical protein ACJX0J_009167, partial [Zea mays]
YIFFIFKKKKELTMACCVLFLHVFCLYFLKQKHVCMNDLRSLDHYMYSVYMYICLCTYVFIIRMHDAG